MLDTLDDVPWASLPQPAWNGPNAVRNAIERLASSDTTDEAQRAYGEFLYAVGNNHAGTFFPVVLRTVAFLGEIIDVGNASARGAALAVLDDLVASFHPEPEHAWVEDNTGTRVELRQLFLAEVRGLSSLLSALAPSDEIARSLLDLLANEGAA